ncbi:phytoene desaturase family protein [Tritonibacter mobilis]|uniref:phytoene desaturase family protein n=1 Tax=Tritonibacter mobilis TaxID=379347 RepID=UPI003A5C12BE
MDQKADAVIIGSGINSLACAMVLQSRGWRVLILEQAEEIGGAVKTGAYTAEGFRHDWAAMNLSLFAGSPFFQRFQDDLMAAGLGLVPAERCFATAFGEDRWLGITNDPERNLHNISAFANNDAETWRALSDQFPARAAHIFALLGTPFKPRPLAKILWRLWRKEGTRGAFELLRFLLSSPRSWLEDSFESPELRSTLAAWGMHLDFAPDVAGGAVFPYLEAMANQSFGMVIGAGGADTVIKAMSSCITRAGGRIVTETTVEDVLIEGGRAVGVRLRDGRVHLADRAVIANVAPQNLAKLVGEETPDYRQKLKRFRHAPGTMMIHLAMEDLPDWQASPELRQFAYVHLAPDMDQMARTYQQAKAGLLPDEPVVVVGQPTAIDPSRAPEGKHVLWMQVRMVPGSIAGDAAGQISARDWHTAAEPMAARALDILERHAPGTRAKIIAQKIVTPDMLEADNPNLVGGDQICGSHHLSQHFLYRPMFGRSDGSTPIERLYHTGAAVWPGAGTGAGAGFLLGQKLAS